MRVSPFCNDRPDSGTRRIVMNSVDTGIETPRPLSEIDYTTPPTLTPKMLAQDFAPLIRRTLTWVTRNTALRESEDELFQEFYLWATTPGTRSGQTPITSYDPARSPAGVFVRMQVRQFCFKRLLRQSRGPTVLRFRSEDNNEDEECPASELSADFVSPCAEPDAFASHEHCRNELFRLIDRPQYQQARTFTSGGVPRCTATIVKLLLSGDLSQREIGKVLDLSPNEVGRRLKALRSERWVQELALEYGYPIDR